LSEPTDFNRHIENALVSDVLIIGSGGAGCAAAHEASQRISRVVMLTRGGFLESKTARAQGGIQAAVSDADSTSRHYADTMAAGENANDPELVQILTSSASNTIDWLEQQGVRFDREGADYRLQGAGGLSMPRILSCGDASGNRIMAQMAEMVKKDGVRVVEYAAVRSIRPQRGFFEVDVLTLQDGAGYCLRTAAIIIAAGGAIPSEKRAGLELPGGAEIPDGLQLATAAGAEVASPDLMQYHPTGIVVPKALRRKPVPEVVRAAGAELLNSEMKPFVDALATRRKVCDAIVNECQRGRCVTTEDGRKGVWLDTPAIDRKQGAGHTMRSFPAFYREMLELGHDITRLPVLVYPLAHYSLGGIRIDANTRTTVSGLFAAGEATWGVHGKDRLMGNSLLDIFVFGRIAGQQAACYAEKHPVPAGSTER